MKLLIDINDLKNYKSRDKIPIECQCCKSIFYQPKNQIQSFIKKGNDTGCFCSRKCHQTKQFKQIECLCKHCDKKFMRVPASIGKNNFCSQSCAAFYNNLHKTKGTSRSKLEIWIESQLQIKYPNLSIIYNNSDTIGLELDIYIPSLKLAFELNGICHYEPLYGADKFNNIQSKDKKKFQLCIEHNISLCIIDVHNVKYLKKERDQKFLDIIINTINDAITNQNGGQ